MTTWFYAGQEDYITKLNDLAAIAELIAGPKGWTPELAVVSDGNRRVLQVADWFDGEGTKPATGEYVGSTGLVSDISLAIDIRGPQGIQGEQGIQGIQGEQGIQGIQGEQGEKGDTGDTGPANNLEIGTVTSGVTADATITGTSPNQTLNLVLPQGPQGDAGNDGAAATITVGTVTTGSPGSSATITNVGTSSAAVFDFSIPRGADGAGAGDVVGPASSTNNAVALFDGTDGKLLKDGGVLGTAAFADEADFATSAQGDLADSAVQPGDLATVATTGSYNDLTDKPTIAADWDDISGKPAYIAAGATQADARAVINAGTSNFDGDYNNLSNKPTIPAAQQQTDWNAVSGITAIANKPAVIAAGADQAAARTAIGAASTSDLAGKQDTLVAGTNIKTINGESPLGVGDLSVSGVPTGSVIFSVSELETPDFLPCNGLLALNSSYPTLSDLINAPVLAGTLTSVSTLNSFGSYRMCVSKDGLSVYTVSSTSPYLRGASINASTGALTSYSDPSGLVNDIGSKEVFTNEDGTLVLCHSSSDVYIYQRSGSTLTSYTSLSISNINAVTTDESLTYIAVAHSSGIRIFKRTGATLNELTLPSSVSGSNNNTTINFTGNGKFLLMGRTTATRFNYCVRNGDTFSELTAVPTQPSATLVQICSSYTGNVILGHDGAPNSNKIWLAASGDQLLAMNSPPTITINSSNHVKISRSGNLISLPLTSSPWATVLKWDGIAWSSNLITSAIGSASSRSVTPVREGVMILVNNNSGNTQTIRNTSSYDHTSQFPLPTQAGKATGVVTTQAYIKT